MAVFEAAACCVLLTRWGEAVGASWAGGERLTVMGPLPGQALPSPEHQRPNPGGALRVRVRRPLGSDPSTGLAQTKRHHSRGAACPVGTSASARGISGLERATCRERWGCKALGDCLVPRQVSESSPKSPDLPKGQCTALLCLQVLKV